MGFDPLHSSVKILSGFSKAFQKARLGILLASSLLMGTVAQAQQTSGERPIVKKIPTTTMGVDLEIDLNKPAYSPLNEALVNNAKDNALIWAISKKNKYSHYLDSLEIAINSKNKLRLSEKIDSTIFDRIFVVDQHQMDIAMALGMKNQNAVLKTIQKEPDIDISNIPFALLFGMNSYYNTQKGDRVLSTSPGVYSSVSRETAIRGRQGFLLPAMIYARSGRLGDIAGLTQVQIVQFFNRHEMAHALDNTFQRELEKVYRETPLDSLDIKLMNEKDHYKFFKTTFGRALFVARLQSEIYGDVYALGEMIRAGDDLNIMDALSNWRQEGFGDLMHLSSSVIKAYKKDIEKMGLDVFRAMSDGAAKAFYIDVTKSYGMTPARLDQALKFYTDHDARRLTRNVSRLFSDNARKGYQFYKAMRYSAAPDYFDQPNRARAKKRYQKYLSLRSQFDKTADDILYVMKYADSYKPRAALINRAYKDHGKITPETVVDAYVSLQNDLMARWERAGTRQNSARAIQERLALLEAEFVKKMLTWDFQKINEDLGVDIKGLWPQQKDTQTFYRKGSSHGI